MATNIPFKGDKRNNYKGGKNFGPRRNERIRAPKIRVIGADGSMLGIMPPYEALAIARKLGLDLLEVSPNAEPPVCRILDYGKYMYEESKKQKSHKSVTVKVKEIKLRPMIEINDFMTKIRAAEKFLYQGNKLKITLMMRGREMEFKDKAFDAVNRAINELSHMGHADSEPKLMGRNIGVSMSPVPANQRKLKFSGENEPVEDGESGQ
ncbi:MAG: translation initiation factor IF-3 [Opitutales bacterium]|jgi:translation initiation factor IF-3|nr:translation initiation factor IF-3 [Opitutales bacterium]